MATAKVTVTLPEEQLEAIREIVDRGGSSSVSGFVASAVQEALEELAGWHRALDEALDASGGALSDDERRWADAVLDRAERSVA